MNFRFLPLACLVTASTFAADAPKLPSIPTEPIAKKKELLFSDDFERAELGKDKGWAIVVPTYSLENGTLKGTQMRFDAPAKDGKPAVKGHQAVIGNDIPTKDSVIEFRFKLGGAQSVTAEFDDRKFNGSHYGHLCMARIGVAGAFELRSPSFPDKNTHDASQIQSLGYFCSSAPLGCDRLYWLLRPQTTRQGRGYPCPPEAELKPFNEASKVREGSATRD